MRQVLSRFLWRIPVEYFFVDAIRTRVLRDRSDHRCRRVHPYIFPFIAILLVFFFNIIIVIVSVYMFCFLRTVETGLFFLVYFILHTLNAPA